LKKFLVVILLVLIVAFVFLGIKFGSALFQEENTAEILTSIAELEFSNSDYTQITESTYGIRYVSKNKNGSQEQIIKEFMKKNEWEFKEQMGAGYIFEKDGITIVVETRLFTKNYFLWNVPNEVFK
jgi:hypothetical protein